MSDTHHPDTCLVLTVVFLAPFGCDSPEADLILGVRCSLRAIVTMAIWLAP